jgi:hypothetical protein
MLGFLILLVFLALGLAMANRIFSEQPMYIRAWTGILIGLLGLTWCVVPFAFIFGFNILSHLLAIILMTFFYLMIRKYYKQEGQLSYKSDGIDIVLYSLLIPITIIIVYLLNTHVLLPKADGLHVGQSTYGDLSMHLGFITSIATQGKFPPDYSIFPGHLLSYPFLVDSLSSSLYLFGTPLRWAVLLPSYFMVLALVAGVFILAFEVLKHKYAAALSTLFFFFNGGFGFAYFMDGLRKNSGNFTRMFTEWYHTPTNFNENNIRWSNTIVDMIIPQRTTLAGWTFVVFAIWLLYRAVTNEDKKYFAYAGVVAGLLPMIHTHSFMALGLIVLTWMIVYFFYTKKALEYIKNWLYFCIPAGILALPQLLFWTFPQATGHGFTRWQFDWANINDIWIWFWTKNVGIVFILLIPAVLAARKKLLSFYSGAILIFIIADIIVFQPNEYDNNKLFYIWYLFSAILVSAFIFSLYNRMKGMRARWSLVAIIVALGMTSGVLTIGREWVSDYVLFANGDVKAADYVKANTAVNATFLTADNHNNAIAALTGRNIVCGSGVFLNFHGINYAQRNSDLEIMYKNPSKFKELADKYSVDYVYYSGQERGRYKIGNPDYFKANYPTVYKDDNEGIYIFAISDSAKKAQSLNK